MDTYWQQLDRGLDQVFSYKYWQNIVNIDWRTFCADRFYWSSPCSHAFSSSFFQFLFTDTVLRVELCRRSPLFSVLFHRPLALASRQCTGRQRWLSLAWDSRDWVWRDGGENRKATSVSTIGALPMVGHIRLPLKTPKTSKHQTATHWKFRCLRHRQCC